MIGEKELNDTLHAMVLEHGLENVERALGRIRKSTVAGRGRSNRSPTRSKQKRKSDAKKIGRKTKITALGYISKLDVDVDIGVPLEGAARQYDNKSFLPTFGDIRNFCAIHGIEVPASPSRVAAIPRIFRYLSLLDPGEMRSMLQSNSFSGPTRLAPIADAIRRSSEKRATDSTADGGMPGSSSEKMETGEIDNSKPPIPSKM